jgi:transcriptional regulator with XRE-family HTH domain
MAKVKPVVSTPSQVRLLNNLRVLMAAAKNAGQTQGRLARAAGIHQSYLSLILRGRRRVTLEVIEALAPLLGTTAEAVLQREFPDPASVSRETLSASTAVVDIGLLQVIARALFPVLSEDDFRALDVLRRSLPKRHKSASIAHSGHKLPKVIDAPNQQAKRA